MRYLVISLFFLLAFQHCQQKSEEFQVFDLDASHPSREVKLSDLAKDLRLVPLETTDESLLPSFFNYIIGNKYIITFTQTNILQFDTNGKFIRTLTKQGKGPGEFEYLSSFVTDNRETRLYVSHYGSDELMVFDLASGAPLKNIATPEKAAELIFVNEDELLAFCYGFDKYQRYRVNVQTGVVSDTVRVTSDDTYTTNGSRSTFITKVNDKIYTLFPDSDTLYQLSAKEFEPELLFRFENKVEYGISNVGRDLYFR
ncbi:MAG: 6-bladed beta-propeller [Bacteroidota bacterium]